MGGKSQRSTNDANKKSYEDFGNMGKAAFLDSFSKKKKSTS